AHRRGIQVLVDGWQAVAHMKVDVQALGCEFYALSGHKMLGPTGIGVLYATSSLLEEIPPYQSGGDMIRSVTFERTLFNTPPYKFEAGHAGGYRGIARRSGRLRFAPRRLGPLAAHRHEVVAHGTDGPSP